jgi:ubiquitin-conjugating enzyme E2 D/E
MSLKRITKEYTEMQTNPPHGITAELSGEDLMSWIAHMTGPTGTPYENGQFTLSIKFDKYYPFKPPIVKFNTPIYHCNINRNGEICLDILKDQWSAALSIEKVLLSISSLLSDPNPNDPLVPNIAQQFQNDRVVHDIVAREWTEKYASGKSYDPDSIEYS